MKLIGIRDPISRECNGTTIFQGSDGEMHPASEYYKCSECQHYGGIKDCKIKARYLLGPHTLSCPKFEKPEAAT